MNASKKLNTKANSQNTYDNEVIYLISTTTAKTKTLNHIICKAGQSILPSSYPLPHLFSLILISNIHILINMMHQHLTSSKSHSLSLSLSLSHDQNVTKTLTYYDEVQPYNKPETYAGVLQSVVSIAASFVPS